jgi:hypothetical protein
VPLPNTTTTTVNSILLYNSVYRSRLLSLSLSLNVNDNRFYFVAVCEGFLKLSLEMDETVLDDIIRKLVSAKNGRTTKQVHLTEADIRQLCSSAKEIFLSQPNLLELEAPIKICGKFLFSFHFFNLL